jgi:hypothetical protein
VLELLLQRRPGVAGDEQLALVSPMARPMSCVLGAEVRPRRARDWSAPRGLPARRRWRLGVPGREKRLSDVSCRCGLRLRRRSIP